MNNGGAAKGVPTQPPVCRVFKKIELRSVTAGTRPDTKWRPRAERRECVVWLAVAPMDALDAPAAIGSVRRMVRADRRGRDVLRMRGTGPDGQPHPLARREPGGRGIRPRAWHDRHPF